MNPKQFEKETRETLSFFVKTDIEIYGKVSKETRRAIKVQGYKLIKNQIK